MTLMTLCQLQIATLQSEKVEDLYELWVGKFVVEKDSGLF